MEKETQKVSHIEDLPDGQLATLWKQGDHQAASVLMDRYCVRLVALVANRLNRKFQGTIDANEIVQSAMGSFFHAARHSRLDISATQSLWSLLATFARRKMARHIESQMSTKRGGLLERVDLDPERLSRPAPSLQASDAQLELLMELLDENLPAELNETAQRLLRGETQAEMAAAMGVDQRTVRRRIQRLRKLLSEETNEGHDTEGTLSSVLPKVHYREFVLGKLLGSGGFGKVYQARMQSDESLIAVKFLRRAFWQNEAAREAFVRETNLAAAVQHRSVVKYLGYGTSPHGGPYILTQWLDGQTLDQISGLDHDRFRFIFVQICEALRAVHQSGVVHADISPRNIIVCQGDHAVLTDFGLSANQSLPGEANVGGGTLGFAAPEQLSRAFGSISERTDLYAMGGLIVWFLSGLPPNRGTSQAEVLTRTFNQGADQSVGSLPDSRLTAVARACLQPHPAQRPASVEAVLSMLDGHDAG